MSNRITGFLVLVIVAFLVIGCGGGGGDESAEGPEFMDIVFMTGVTPSAEGNVIGFPYDPVKGQDVESVKQDAFEEMGYALQQHLNLVPRQAPQSTGEQPTSRTLSVRIRRADPNSWSNECVEFKYCVEKPMPTVCDIRIPTNGPLNYWGEAVWECMHRNIDW